MTAVPKIGHELQRELGFREGAFYNLTYPGECSVAIEEVTQDGVFARAGFRAGDLLPEESHTSLFKRLHRNRGWAIAFAVADGGKGPHISKRPRRQICFIVPGDPRQPIRQLTRRFLIIVIAMTLAGMAIADCCVMISKVRPNRSEVKLDESIPAVLLGGPIRFITASIAGLLWYRSPRFRFVVTVCAPLILCGGLGGMFGWSFGDMLIGRWPERGMLIGALGGAIVGLAIGIKQARDYERIDELEINTSKPFSLNPDHPK